MEFEEAVKDELFHRVAEEILETEAEFRSEENGNDEERGGTTV